MPSINGGPPAQRLGVRKLDHQRRTSSSSGIIQKFEYDGDVRLAFSLPEQKARCEASGNRHVGAREGCRSSAEKSAPSGNGGAISNSGWGQCQEHRPHRCPAGLPVRISSLQSNRAQPVPPPPLPTLHPPPLLTPSPSTLPPLPPQTPPPPPIAPIAPAAPSPPPANFRLCLSSGRGSRILGIYFSLQGEDGDFWSEDCKETFEAGMRKRRSAEQKLITSESPCKSRLRSTQRMARRAAKPRNN